MEVRVMWDYNNNMIYCILQLKAGLLHLVTIFICPESKKTQGMWYAHTANRTPRPQLYWKLP